MQSIMSDKIPGTIAIVDGHALTRKTLSCRFSSLGYTVVMEAENGKEFIDKLKAHSTPDVCLLDVNLPVAGVFETTIRVKREWPGIKILLFSMFKSDAYIGKLKEMGVDGFISKSASFSELNDALISIMKKAQTNSMDCFFPNIA
jgi:DNA-binding NarL/FixJ family response regulator